MAKDKLKEVPFPYLKLPLQKDDEGFMRKIKNLFHRHLIDAKYLANTTVKNIKIQERARAHTAIVDPSGGGDYKTIQEAINYTHGLGGGSVLLMPGMHIPTDNLTLYNNVSIEGRTPQDTIISFATAAKSVLIKGSGLYATGTITINPGEVTVVGDGTLWLANLAVGQHILLGASNWFQITAIADNTHLTIANKYFGNPLAGASYKAATVKNNVELRNLSVILSGGIGIDVQYANNLKLHNVFSLYHVSDALKLDVTNWNILDYFIAGHCGGRGVYFNEMYNSSCDRFFLFNNVGIGLEFEGNSEDNSFDFVKSYNNAIGAEINASISNTFHRIDCKYNTAEGIKVNGGSHTAIDTIAMSNGGDGVKLLGNSDNIILKGCLLKDNTGWGVNISAATCDNTLIDGCEFSGNTAGTLTDSGTGTRLGTNVGIPYIDSVALEATVARFQANASTGDFDTNPDKINDNETGTNCIATAINQYSEVDFDKVVAIRRWRQFGNAFNDGSGRWKIQYYNLVTHAWIDWVTDIPTRASADWSSLSTETVVYTDKIRLVATTIDTGTGSSSRITELEVIY